MEAYTSFAEVYDTFMDNVPYEEWGEYIHSLLKDRGIEDGILLDLGCGTGTMTEKLADYGYDMIGVGWTLDGVNFLGGSLRMLFPFSLGMLLSRNFNPFQMKGAFWICSIVLLILFCVPYIKADTAPISLNGLFEAACIILIFPVLVWLGASGKTTDKRSTQICKF